MKYLIGLFLLANSGCLFDPDYRCVDGVVYENSGGIWIEHKWYKDNKCQPL